MNLFCISKGERGRKISEGPPGKMVRCSSSVHSRNVRGRHKSIPHFMHGPTSCSPPNSNLTTMDPIEAALEDLRSQKVPNYTQTAKKYGCDRSTLSRCHRGVTSSKENGHYSQ